jgi:hypothetical protein
MNNAQKNTTRKNKKSISFSKNVRRREYNRNAEPTITSINAQPPYIHLENASLKPEHQMNNSRTNNAYWNTLSGMVSKTLRNRNTRWKYPYTEQDAHLVARAHASHNTQKEIVDFLTRRLNHSLTSEERVEYEAIKHKLNPKNLSRSIARTIVDMEETMQNTKTRTKYISKLRLHKLLEDLYRSGVRHLPKE